MKNKHNLQFWLSALITFCFWLIVFVFCIVEEDHENSSWFLDWSGALRLIPYFSIYICIAYWLIPKYLKNDKLGKFFALSAIVVVAIISLWTYFVSPILPLSKLDLNFHRPPPSRQHPPFFILLLIGFFVFAFFTAKSFILKMIKTENEKKELERLKAEAELKLFRYQLNPHFLMNMLNNIHALIDIDGKTAQDSVRILSKMMRYMLYDSNHEKVEFYKEIDFLQNYFELMRKRYIEQVEITFLFPEIIPTILIPPALFINFVENSFKHGVSYLDNSFIYCKITIEANEIICIVRNSKPRVASVGKIESGCGLDILKKRLDILYPNRYSYIINDTLSEYKVELKIPIL